MQMRSRDAKKGKGKDNRREDERVLLMKVPLKPATVLPADPKLVERQRQSKVERLLAR